MQGPIAGSSAFGHPRVLVGSGSCPARQKKMHLGEHQALHVLQMGQDNAFFFGLKSNGVATSSVVAPTALIRAVVRLGGADQQFL